MLDLIIKNGLCFVDGKLQKKNLGVKDGKITENEPKRITYVQMVLFFRKFHNFPLNPY